jgi:branched-subunit amino acid transport protein
MRTWIVVVVAGSLSYALRALPQVAWDRLRTTPTLERVLHHAGTAAIASLCVAGALSVPADEAGGGAEWWLALAAGLVTTRVRPTIAAVTAAGIGTFWIACATRALV